MVQVVIENLEHRILRGYPICFSAKLDAHDQRAQVTFCCDAFKDDELDQLARLLERFSLALIQSEGSIEGLCLRCSAYFDEACPIRHLHDGCPYQKLAASDRRERRRLRALGD